MDQDCELDRIAEELWVFEAMARDRQAFAKLVDLYDRRLFYFVRRFAPDWHRAADVMQEVWLAAFKQLPKLRSPAFRAWLYRIAHDKAMTLIAREHRSDEAHEALAAQLQVEGHDVEAEFD